MPRPRHKCKETEAVLGRIQAVGWSVVYPSGHWGRAECGGGCRIGIHGTPKDCTDQSRIIARRAKRCPHGHNVF